MMWYTDEQLRRIPALADLDPTAIPEVVAAAGRVYAHVSMNAGISDGDLRSWAESSAIQPERFNAAVAVLAQAGKAISLDGSAPAPVVPEGDLAGLVGDAGLVPASVFSKDELRAAVDRAKLDVPKSASKDDLARALAEAPRG